MRRFGWLSLLASSFLLCACGGEENVEQTSTDGPFSSLDSAASDSSTEEHIDPDEVTTSRYDYTLMEVELEAVAGNGVQETILSQISQAASFGMIEKESYSYSSLNGGESAQVSYSIEDRYYEGAYSEGSGLILNSTKNGSVLVHEESRFSGSSAIKDYYLYSQKQTNGSYEFDFFGTSYQTPALYDYQNKINLNSLYLTSKGVTSYLSSSAEQTIDIKLGGTSISALRNVETVYILVYEEGDGVYYPTECFTTTKTTIERNLQNGLLFSEPQIESLASTHWTFNFGDSGLEDLSETFIEGFPSPYLAPSKSSFSYAIGNVVVSEETGTGALIFEDPISLPPISSTLSEDGKTMEVELSLSLEEETLKIDDNGLYIGLSSSLAQRGFVVESEESSSLEESSQEETFSTIQALENTLELHLNIPSDELPSGISVYQDGANSYLKIDSSFQGSYELLFTYSFLLEEGSISIDDSGVGYLSPFPSNA